MIYKKITCSETMENLDDCKCPKCEYALELFESLDETPEDGTDQAKIFDMAVAHLIFPTDEGDSFEELMKKAQE
jgi:hypothetical protein